MTSSLLLVADFDDTLAYTQDAVRAAYGVALGGPICDDHWAEIWGKSGRGWCLPEVKKRKILAYPDMLREYGKLTPFGQVIGWDVINILTSASLDSVIIATDILKPNTRLNLSVLGWGCDVHQKRKILTALRPRADGQSYYFDDDIERGQAAVWGSGFEFCHVSHNDVRIFTNRTWKKGEGSWTLLSLLLAPMNVSRVSYLPTTSPCSSSTGSR